MLVRTISFPFHPQAVRRQVNRHQVTFSRHSLFHSLRVSTRQKACLVRKFSTHRHECAPAEKTTKKLSLRENIYTFPNLLTISRICACPLLGWSIVQSDFHLATALLCYAGLTDLADGYMARRYNMKTVLGTLLDPLADKILMTTLTVTLAWEGLLPLPVAGVVLGRDVLLIISGFYVRHKTLPAPKTFSRYWDVSVASAEIRPTIISKVNTALQLGLMGLTTVHPILPLDLSVALTGFQSIVVVTTIWSGLSYVFSKDAVRFLSQRKPPST